MGTYRGPGGYEQSFSRERFLDIMAQDLGIGHSGVAEEEPDTPGRDALRHRHRQPSDAPCRVRQRRLSRIVADRPSTPSNTTASSTFRASLWTASSTASGSGRWWSRRVWDRLRERGLWLHWAGRGGGVLGGGDAGAGSRDGYGADLRRRPEGADGVHHLPPQGYGPDALRNRHVCQPGDGDGRQCRLSRGGAA